jgi:2-polyprenyl-3-methyl-5-hydroxy-6-metoxy-1,4-benzoquinol methylase
MTLRADQLNCLCCPSCKRDLHSTLNARQEYLECDNGHQYAVIEDIPRFVSSQNYASTFGYQWNKYDRVQVDSHNRSGFSAQRFRDITGWTAEDLRDRSVLDAGCGAGRFAEIVAKEYGAQVFAVDLSTAVEACKKNLAPYNCLVSQASIYDLPFKDGIFDYVYCIGVIQHTPSPEKSIRALCRLVKPGGQIALWIYELNWKCLAGTAGFKYALRPVTSRISRKGQILFSDCLVRLCYPLVSRARKWGLPGKWIMRALPVASAHLQPANLSDSDFKAWVFLDTFDMYSPKYDKPQRLSSVTRILTEQGFKNIQRHQHGALSLTATRDSKT